MIISVSQFSVPKVINVAFNPADRIADCLVKRHSPLKIALVPVVLHGREVAIDSARKRPVSATENTFVVEAMLIEQVLSPSPCKASGIGEPAIPREFTETCRDWGAHADCKSHSLPAVRAH